MHVSDMEMKADSKASKHAYSVRLCVDGSVNEGRNTHTHTHFTPSVCVGTGWRGSYGQTLVVMTESVLQAKIKQTSRNCFCPFSLRLNSSLVRTRERL